MKIEQCKILKNEKIAPDVYQMTLGCETSWIKRSGQFVEVTVEPKKLKPIAYHLAIKTYLAIDVPSISCYI